MQNVFSVCRAIDLCIEKKLTLPALILLYSGIDIVASLERAETQSVRESFTTWVDRYLLKAKTLPCTALDLYAARCAVLHTLTPDSDLSRDGKARPIIYAWGTASASDLQKGSDIVNTGPYVALHVGDINEAFRLGVANFLEDVEKDPTRLRCVQDGLGRWFDGLATEDLSAFLKVVGARK